MNIESVTAAEKVLNRKLRKYNIAAEKLNNPKINRWHRQLYKNGY